MDYDNKKPPDDEQPGERSNVLLHLADAQVGETETDEPMPRRVSFEMPTPSTLEGPNLDEIKALVKDMIDSILPNFEPERETSSSTLTSMTTTSATMGYDDERLQRILRLLDRCTRNLEVFEEHMLNASREAQSSQADERSELTQQSELATHTQTRSQNSPNRISSLRFNQQQQQQQQQRQQQQQLQQGETEVIPPCERRHHIITISANGSSRFTAPVPPRTFMGRIGRSLGDIAGALCLCLQVNKDCIFCLGFFLAFVISASFLTAFFYRTINLSATPIRVPIDHVRSNTSVPSGSEAVTMRINGGYYYIYNTHRQHFV